MGKARVKDPGCLKTLLFLLKAGSRLIGKVLVLIWYQKYR